MPGLWELPTELPDDARALATGGVGEAGVAAGGVLEMSVTFCACRVAW